VVQNQDNREHDLLDSAEYASFEGGLAAAVELAAGRTPVVYHADHADPERPRVHTLDQELSRVLRGRLVNPKWIAGVMRHGYKGAAEMAAGVDNLLAFASTTGAVRSHHFDLVGAAYLKDEAVRAFLTEVNPAALDDIRAALAAARDAGLWRPRDNRIFDLLTREPPP
jgi:cobaltochelatase CobN